MNFLNDDFAEATGRDSSNTNANARGFREFYLSTHPSLPDDTSFTPEAREALVPSDSEHGRAGVLGTLFWNTMVLSERTAVNYSRNLLAYGVRAGMYAGALSVHLSANHLLIEEFAVGMGLMLAYDHS
jgi:hypothetical protein